MQESFLVVEIPYIQNKTYVELFNILFIQEKHNYVVKHYQRSKVLLEN